MLTPSDIQRIETAVAAAERHTRGEIVVADVSQSSDYLTFRLKIAVLALALAEAALAIADTTGHLRVFAVEAMAIRWAAAVAVFAFASRPSVLRRILPKRLRARKVHARALDKFLEHNVHATREHTGVLILLSRLEQRVEIVVDRGAAKLPQDFWDKQAERVAAGLRAQQAASALVEAIGAIGAALAGPLPPTPGGGGNELSNVVRT